MPCIFMHAYVYPISAPSCFHRLENLQYDAHRCRMASSWNANFDISGIISGLGQGIVKKVSEEKIAEIINNVKNVLEAK